MKKIGFTIGKFAPFHKGHQYLIETGLAECDEFYVVVYETDVVVVEIVAAVVVDITKTIKIFANNNVSSSCDGPS